MKKTISKILSVALVTSVLSIFTGCNDSVFSSIMQDVPPTEATINGIINSIARYNYNGTECLFTTASSGLIYKEADGQEHGQWKKLSDLPFETHSYDYYGNTHRGQQIIKVVSDATNLYLVTVAYKNDIDLGTTIPDSFHIWAAANPSTKEDWKEIEQNEQFKLETKIVNKLAETDFNVFSTNELNNSKREAYVRVGGTISNTAAYFKLNGQSAPSSKTISKATDNGNLNNIDAAVYLGSTLHFFDTFAVTTNNEGTTTTGSVAYYAPINSANLYYTDGTTSTEALSASYPVSSLAYTKGTLFIGRGDYVSSTYSYGGIAKTSVAADGTPNTELEKFTTNAESQLSSAYIIYTLLVTTPEETELNTTVYAGMGFRGSGTSTAVNYKNIGLWSYYPARKNWNRE